MIDDISPEHKAKGMQLVLRDPIGGRLSLHVNDNLAGIVVSDPDSPQAGCAIHLDRQDRAALISALIELQEDEKLP